MPRAKRPLADADANAAPAPKSVSKGSSTGQDQENQAKIQAKIQAIEYEKRTVPELARLLKDRSLPHSGKKVDLVRRLMDADVVGTPAHASLHPDTPPSALEFHCLCRPVSDWIDQQKAEDEDFDEDDLCDMEEHPTCCGTDKCVCHKSPADFPDCKWVISKAGTAATGDLAEECQKRDQDMHEQYIYNDFSGHGFQEAMENHLVAMDKELRKSKPNITALWPMLEALAFAIPDNQTEWFNNEDGEGVLETLRILGGAVICALRVLEEQDMLKPDSDIKNIALVLGHINMIVQDWPSGEEEDELSWIDAAFYMAMKNGIEFTEAPYGIEEAVGDISADSEGSQFNTPIDWSSFNWKKEFAKFKHDFTSGGKLGGDQYDLTKGMQSSKKGKSKKSGKKSNGGGVAITLGPGENIEDFL